MKLLIETLQQASTNSYSWVIVGLIALATLASIYKWRTCPYLCHSRQIGLTEARSRLDQPFVAGSRFVVVMLAGIAAILGGLAMVSLQVTPLLALLLIVLGVFVVQVEPALLRLRESVERLVAAQVQGPDRIAAAEERLRYAHLWLVTANLAILASVTFALLAI